MNISKRLQAVAAMVSDSTFGDSHRVVDVGTDHGYIPIFLMKSGKISEAVAMDVNEGPLSKADFNIHSYGFEDRISTCLSDGLEKYQAKPEDSIVIAGMGGLLMIRILAEGMDKLSKIRELILQPQSDIGLVRHFLHDHGFIIDQENMLIDDGKYYTMMHAVWGPKDDLDTAYEQPWMYAYGKLLVEHRHPVLKQFLEKELSVNTQICCHLEAVGSQTAFCRADEMRKEIAMIKEVLDIYDRK